MRAKHIATSFIQNLEFQYKLRICNAYPYGSPLDVYIGERKLTEQPLQYKSCGEWTPKLQSDDRIDFKVEDSAAGSFTIEELPNNDAVLLMVIYRHDTISTAVSFESHVFSRLLNAQVAVIDTYKGVAKGELRIQDKDSAQSTKEGTPQTRTELLRYDSVVAVNPGLYEVVLQNEAGEQKAKTDLVAASRESYIVLRCGVEASEGVAYPQELMVYPHSDPAQLGGASPVTRPLAFAVLVSIAAFLFSAVSF